MTTETPHDRRSSGASAMRGAVLLTAGAGALGVLAGGLVSGSAGALGALVGAGVTLGTFAFGTVLVDRISHLAPAASMVVALVTYVFQILLVLLVLVVLEDAGLVGETLHRGWLGGLVMATAGAWMVAQVWLHTRLRIPLYDLTERPVVAAAPEAPEGGSR